MVDATALAAHLSYSAWASRRLLDFAAGIPGAHLTQEIANSHGGILKTFQHVYYADRIWLARMEGAVPTDFADPEPGPTLAELNDRWFGILERLETWAAQQDSNRIVAYKNIKGEDFAKPIYLILLHVVNHATYHRGQIAAMLRQLGHVPPFTDLIYYMGGLRA